MTFRIDRLLEGTTLGPVQRTGFLELVPLLGDDDATFAPPALEVSTCRYGVVQLRNDADRPTLVPTGAGWVVRQKAQDHALGGAAFVAPGATRVVETALCIQQTQAGCIRAGKHAMVVLPVALRGKALAQRHVADFRKHWDDIGAFNRALGIEHGGGHLETFLRTFERQLAQFVAELEVVPRQVGALVLCDDALVGIERTPSTAFWRAVFEPLVRVSYGSLAVQVARQRAAPAWALREAESELPAGGGVAAIRAALAEADARTERRVRGLAATIGPMPLEASADEDAFEGAALATVTAEGLSGQVVTVGGDVRYASLCVAA